MGEISLLLIAYQESGWNLSAFEGQLSLEVFKIQENSKRIMQKNAGNRNKTIQKNKKRKREDVRCAGRGFWAAWRAHAPGMAIGRGV